MRRYAGTVCGWLMALAVGACGKTEAEGGGAGSETHWLSACEKPSDCEVGECLAGICTVACSSVRDCPAPLDTCQAPRNNVDGNDQKLCLIANAGRSEQALQPLPAPETRVTAKCDDGRSSEALRTNLGFGPFESDAPPFRVAVDRPRGFLAFGGNDATIHRLDSSGGFVRTLPSPSPSKPLVDDVAVLDDGSVLLAGFVEGWAGDTLAGVDDKVGRGWLGKVDADWNLVWERELELLPLGRLDVEPLPDGGALVAGLMVPYARVPGDTLVWARVSAEGEVVWEQRAELALPNVTSLLSSGLLALTGQAARIAVTTQDGVVLVTTDFDGNSGQSLLRNEPGVIAHEVQGLPDGRFALLCSDALLLLDGEGSVVWQQSFTAGLERPRALAYDPTRAELVVAGARREQDDGDDGSWLAAWDLEQHQTWQLHRKPWPITPEEGADAGTYGYPLDDVDIDDRGNTLALKLQAGSWLSRLWVGTNGCSD